MTVTASPAPPVNAARQAPYEGKAKIITPCSTAANQLRVTFKDDATAFNGEKFAQFKGKGQLNATISAFLFNALEQQGIPTCFVANGDTDNELIYHALAMIPLEVVVRNVALGSICKRYGLPEGHVFEQPLVEFFYKKDELGDPLLSVNAIDAMNLVPDVTSLNALVEAALAANRVLTAVFDAVGIQCADFKLEFGLNDQNQLLLADELSPDNFRLRDKAAGTILDKDTFRLDEGNLVERYQQVWTRLEAMDAEQAPLPATAFKADVMVCSRKNVLSPQSRTVSQYVAADTQGAITQVLANKHFGVTVNARHHLEARTLALDVAQRVLSNPVIEDATVIQVSVLNS